MFCSDDSSSGRAYGQVASELRIGTLLERLDLVPEGFRSSGDRAVGDHRADPFRGIGREQEFLMHKPLFPSVVDGTGLALVFHLRAVPIGRRQHGTAAATAADDAG